MNYGKNKMKEDFLKYVREHYELYEGRLIEQAYKLAASCHAGYFRESGDPWIDHCVGVAHILAKMHMDADTVCAGLLHDSFDYDLTSKEISDQTNDNIDELVKGVAKINGIKYDKTQDEAERLRRLLVAMGKDIRVIIIKIADRLDNMRSIDALPRDRQIKYATESQQVFVSLAERLGFNKVYTEMEDLCFKTLNPEEYQALKSELDRKFDKWQEKMRRINGMLEYVLDNKGIKGKISSRFKSFYSLYKKSQTKGTEKIYDIMAFRILVDEVDDCYRVLGAVHQVFKPIPERIKDYIASPKANGYQSLHTTVITDDGTPFELQIRTFAMHEYCEYGIASHWRYKGESDEAFILQEKLDWVKNLIESDMPISDNKNFVKAIQMDFSTSEIWVFTPKYKPISLPENATPIDFAYAVHTELGDKCVSAKVNGKKVSLASKLETGDVVEIITSKESKGPSRDWLDVVVSYNARKNIKWFFRHEMTSQNVVAGKSILQKEAEKLGITLGDIIADDIFNELKQKYYFESVDDMFASVGYKGVTVNQILKPVIVKIDSSRDNSELLKTCPFIVEGQPVVNYKLSHCCSPIPGDEIVATVSKEGHYSIHTKDCKNLKFFGENCLQAKWNDNIKKLYDVQVSFFGEDCTGALNEVLNIIHDKNNTLNSVHAKALSNNRFEFIIDFKVANKDELNELIDEIKVKLPFVKSVTRKNIG